MSTEDGIKSIECGQTSHHIARLQLEHGDVKYALENAQRAAKIYADYKDKYVENILECYILEC